MITHNLIQGTPEWHAYRATHDNASDAPAMKACSTKRSRDQLIAELATGLQREFSQYVQERILDKGHEFEALARPLAEKIIGQDLYPCTGSLEGSRLSASFDGLTMLEEVAFEHKRLNQQLRAALSVPECTGADLPLEYQVQMEQQCAVSACERILFMASDWDDDGQLVEELHCWYYPNLELRAQIVAGWEQLHKDVAAWVPPEAKPAPVVAKTVGSLPVVFDMRVEGKLVACNLEQYKPAALAYIAAINTELATDQDFADADADAKFCRDSAKKLELAIEQALGQMGDINAALSAVRDIAAAFDTKGLALEKLVKAKKDSIKLAEVHRGQSELAEHIAQLNAAMPVAYMPAVPADFAAAVKNKRTVDSLRGAVNDELARAKIAASEIATRIHANVKTLQASGLVVHDAAALVLKAPDDLAAIIANRVTAEQQRQDAERERIRQEEQAKAQRDAREADAKREREQQEALRQQVLQAERDAQSGIAEARAAEALPAPLLDDLASLAKDLKDDVVAGIDADQAISTAQRAAAAGPAVIPLRAPAPAERTGTPTLKLGQIGERLGFALTADFIKSLGFAPAATDRASKLYYEADFPAILAALVRHIESVQSKAAA